MRAPLLLPLLLLLPAAPALAQDRDFCANRPGIGTPACTMAPGSAMLETGVAEWDHSADAGGSEDSATFGQFLLRVGVNDSTEVQFGLDSHTLDRTFDRAGHLVARSSGIGNAFLAVRSGVAGPNGPVAVEGFVSAPANDTSRWSAGLLLPAGINLPAGFQLALTPEVDLAADADRHGRHIAYGGVIGVSHAVSTRLTAGAELAAFEDADPSGHALDARLTGELAWQIRPRLQVDVEADAGLSAGAPDTAVMFGFAARL
jgi:outer membrane putative beta-barrel porin/alpha-amylase